LDHREKQRDCEIYTRVKTPSRTNAFPRPARADLAQGRVDDGKRFDRRARTWTTSAATVVSSVAVGSMLGIEAPHAEHQADEDDAPDNRQQQDRKGLVDRNGSQH
jgi:hypothetical protein